MATSLKAPISGAVALLLLSLLSLPALGASAAELNRDASAALQALYKRYPETRELGKSAKAILIFPSVVKAGLMVGGEYGEGVLRKGGKTASYYSTSGVSYGLQVGAQKFGYALFLMTDGAVKSLDAVEGLEIGVGPSVVVMDDGMAKKASSTTTKSDVYAFIFSQQGLMAGLGLQGNKITRLDKR